jgi:tRNA1(Val) A37 N6-methylase TrmN6
MDETGEAAIQDRRVLFPRGMMQPEQGHRFGLDPLLLASFVSVRPGENILDLGTGCGVAGLALLLRNEEARSTGVDISAEMIACATRNAERLGLAGRFEPLLLDVLELRADERIRPESFDQVMVNPPFRAPGHGREPADHGMRQARFELLAGLGDFLRAGFYALKNRGTLTLIHLAVRLGFVFQAVSAAGLEVQRMRCVHSSAHSRAKLVLIQARKNGKPGLEIEPPLVLYERDQQGRARMSGQALEFCPFLRCNP